MEATAPPNIERLDAFGGKSEVFVQCFSNPFSTWPHRPIQSAGDERRARTCAFAQNPRQHAETAGVVPRGHHSSAIPQFSSQRINSGKRFCVCLVGTFLHLGPSDYGHCAWL